jgi:hypothetical protein
MPSERGRIRYVAVFLLTVFCSLTPRVSKIIVLLQSEAPDKTLSLTQTRRIEYQDEYCNGFWSLECWNQVSTCGAVWICCCVIADTFVLYQLFLPCYSLRPDRSRFLCLILVGRRTRTSTAMDFGL